jgi:iron complex outermembrane receptor protein
MRQLVRARTAPAAVRPSVALLAALAALPLARVRADDAAPAGEAVVRSPRAEAAADPTASATVVDARRFAGESKTVAELVTTAPGVAVDRYGGLGQLSTISIRGSTADEVQVFLDGLPLNNAAGGGVDLSRIPHAWIDRIEIVRGTAGAVYGPGAVGGAVNIITRKAAAGRWSAEATAGAFRTFSGAADGAIGGERWGLLGAAAFDTTRGDFVFERDDLQAVPGNPPTPVQRLHNASTSGGGLAKLWADLGTSRLDAVLQLSGGRRDLPGTAFHPKLDDEQHDGRAGLVARLSRALAEDWDLALTVTAREDRLSVLVVPFTDASQRDHAADAGARLVWTSGPSALTLSVTGGGEELESVGGETHTWGKASATVEDELTLASGRLRLTPVARWDLQGPFGGWSAKLGAAWRFTDVLTVRANGGRTFRVPSFAELYLQQGTLEPNPDLVPEDSWSADLGLVADGRLGLLTVGVFTQLYRNLIVYEAQSLGRMKPFNDGKASASGLEAELASAPFGAVGFTASAAYTYLATETLRGSEGTLGKSLPHRAAHRLFGRLAIAPGPLEAHGEVHFVSGQYLDVENSSSLYVGPSLTFNLGGSVRLWSAPETRLHFEVRNLLDDRSLQDGFGNPLPGRMALVTVRIAG